MPYYRAVIAVYMEVDGWWEAVDCIAETMRDHCRRNAPLSSITDWDYWDGDPHTAVTIATKEEAFPYDPSDDIT